MQKLKGLLSQARTVKGVSLREVEKATGVSNAYLSQLETGAVHEPSPRILHKLATYYGLSYPALMEATGYLVPAERGRPESDELMFMGEKLSDGESAAMAAFLHQLRARLPKKR